MKIGFGCDHAAVTLKCELIAHMRAKGFDCIDFGSDDPNAADNYPERALMVAQAVMRGDVSRGVLVCGTGVGMSIAANKVPGIRAAVCNDLYTAELSVRHNNANIITLGARIVAPDLAKKIVDTFFDASFEGGRHAVRVGMIADIEKTYGTVWHE